jgi:hypothetical protein
MFQLPTIDCVTDGILLIARLVIDFCVFFIKLNFDLFYFCMYWWK